MNSYQSPMTSATNLNPTPMVTATAQVILPSAPRVKGECVRPGGMLPWATSEDQADHKIH